MRTWALAVGFAATVAGGGQAEYPTLKARPKPLAGIPNYPYEPTNPPAKPTVTGTGQSRITLGGDGDLLPTPAGTTAGTTTRETQTCRSTSLLRRVEKTTTREQVTTGAALPGPVPNELATFTLREATLTVGDCRVSGVSVAMSPDGWYAVRFRADVLGDRAIGLGARRHLVLLTVRGYAADPLGETSAATRTAVVQFPVEAWVNRGEPYSGFVEGKSEAVRRNYKWIERVDVDFTYR